jgi:2-C-methyl-D-erythritol 2,4-cyclodiphosphate synthase
MRTGFGYDSHRLIEGRKLVLGGVEIPFGKGLAGHSDADVLCHAIIDAIIGGLGLGDIGRHFPDTDPKWKDAVSTDLLKHILGLAAEKGYSVSWVDTTIITEQPKIAPHVDAIKDSLAKAGIPREILNIKAKTNEGMGFTGRGEGIAVFAVCTIEKTGS